eukprot:TRINITY_DN61324_c0_g1_i2.p1 TRINITY_DN61324_c0_g1~~TRINITY_DN61324_c0_g1_i2.p1  ORF type:complete len:185 (-),score=11.68 TRINITY_DN61324_c0_g1_i2:110-664(-)
MMRRPPRSTLSSSSAASDVYKRQIPSNFLQNCKSFTNTPPHNNNNTTAPLLATLPPRPPRSNPPPTTATITSLFSNATTISKGFLTGCTSLVYIDLRPLANVTKIDSSFLAGCTSLPLPSSRIITLPLLLGEKSTPATSDRGDTTIAAVDFTPFDKVKSIGPSFMGDCDFHIHILSPLQNAEGY